MKESKLSPNQPQLLNREQRRKLGVKVAVGYVRVSTDRQQKFGISLVTQETEIKEKAESLDYIFGQLYVDGGISGADIDHRLGMLQLLEDAAKGLFDAVFIYSVSRASRDLEDFLLIVSTLERHRRTGKENFAYCSRRSRDRKIHLLCICIRKGLSSNC